MDNSSSRQFNYVQHSKLAYLALVLIVWKLFYDHTCLIFIFSSFSVVVFLSLSFAESSLLYRRSFAHAIFRQSSWIFSWLQTKWFVLLKSIFKALFFGIILLIGVLQWNLSIALVMVADVLLLLLLYRYSVKHLNRHVKEGLTELMARRLAVILNMFIALPLLVSIMFYGSSPEFLDNSLVTTLKNTQQIAEATQCQIVSMLYGFDLAKEGFGWWAIFKASSGVGNTALLVLGWIVFLAFQTMYIWLFSRLVLSTTIEWNLIFHSAQVRSDA